MDDNKNLSFIKDFADMAYESYLMGWHERNGGNMSYRLKESEARDASFLYNTNAPWQKLDVTVPGIAGDHFLVTGSGKYFKNIARDPADTLCILQISENGDSFRILWGLENGGAPTSELSSHLLNHDVKKHTADGESRIMYHGHPENVIALTFVLPCDETVFTARLHEMMPECRLTFPEGVGVVPELEAGSLELGKATSEKMRGYNAVIWTHHGLFVSGKTFDETFGLFHTVEKAASILVKVIAMS
ncbi:MAG: rhamnulose-1-phosphate aldolase [Lachnospiraceae bacterium]|nr:rhamnulose-1-phosphate aldolase [Lachnospiraceae bacterium]